MGLIKRYRDANDDRVVVVELTEEGRKLKENITCVPDQMCCKLNMSDEEMLELKDSLNNLLEKLG